MKKVNLDLLDKNAGQIVPSSPNDRIVLTRQGKPVAIVTAVENLDEEDLGYIDDPRFWKMISERRKDQRVTLAEAKARLDAREKSITDKE